jgi:hypothetical protein
LAQPAPQLVIGSSSQASLFDIRYGPSIARGIKEQTHYLWRAASSEAAVPGSSPRRAGESPLPRFPSAASCTSVLGPSRSRRCFSLERKRPCGPSRPEAHEDRQGDSRPRHRIAGPRSLGIGSSRCLVGADPSTYGRLVRESGAGPRACGRFSGGVPTALVFPSGLLRAP